MEMNNYFIPQDITMNILSRLPAASVLQCISVCKTWRNLIVYDLEFAYMHLQRGVLECDHSGGAASSFSKGKVNFLLYVRIFDTGYQLYCTVDDDNHEKPTKRFRALRLNPPYNDYHVVGSCNGLICMCSGTSNSYQQPIYICNPITRECVNLPSLIINQSSDCSTTNNPMGMNKCVWVVCGFGYVPSTNEYKVVRIFYCNEEQPSVGRVQVYTLGGGTGWRDKGEITHAFADNCLYSRNTLPNGALQWLDDNEKIVAFDLAEEEFLMLPSPPCFLRDNEEEDTDDGEEYPFRIQVLGGQLCAIHCKNDVSMDVWSLKTKNDENGNYDVNGRQKYQFWSWVKEFSIGLDLKEGIPMPFIFTKHGDILYYRRATLFLYDRKTATSEKLDDVEEKMFDLHLFQAIPHVNSFVSLKALGEEDTKTIELANS